MIDYLRWSLRQFYLGLFFPSQFRREVGSGLEAYPDLISDDEPLAKSGKGGVRFRLLYTLKILPSVVVTTIVMILVVGILSHFFEVAFSWSKSLLSLAALLITGLLFGLFFRIEVGLSVSLLCATGFGIFGGFGFSEVGVLVVSIAFGLAASIWLGLDMVEELGVRQAVESGFVMAAMSGFSFGLLVFRLEGGALGMTLSMLGFLIGYFGILGYPMNFALCWITYLTGKKNPSKAERAWQWCPVVWNELLWLPVPFASKLLAQLTQQQRDKGFDQMKLLARERPLQRRVALSAVSETILCDLTANTMERLASIPERTEWINDPPAALVSELTYSLPRVDRISHYVMQYLALGSPQRRVDALADAIHETQVLEVDLASVHGRFGRRLRSVTRGWHSLLEGEMRFQPQYHKEEKDIANPFVAGNALAETTTNIFVGRRDIVNRIEANMLNTWQTPTLLLLGARRMGKTSILLQLHRLLGPDFIPAIIDCQDPAVVGSEASLFRYLSREIRKGLSKRRIGIHAIDESGLKKEPFAVFDEWLREIEFLLKGKKRLLICLDEYERLQQTLEAGWGGKVLDQLRHILQHHSRFILMFAGTHSFQEFGSPWMDRFINARSIRVSFLSREEVLPLLTQPVPDFDMTYADGALDRIIDATNGHPFLTQAVAYELVDCMNEKHSREATVAAVEEAIVRATEKSDVYFAKVWDDAKAEGQLAMLAVLRKEKSPTKWQGYQWLRDHDVLTNGQFAVPMMEMWVKEKFHNLPEKNG